MLKNLVVVILTPPNIWLHTCKFPNTLHFPIPNSALSMGVAFDGNLFHICIRILLVSDAHLVIPCDFRIADFDPLGRANEVLCFQERITEDMRVRCHGDEVGSGEGFP